jgi:two-component system, LytTR family, response regulator
MNYSYIIIDDNQDSISETKAVVARFQNLHFVASANTYDEGLNLILEHNPNLIFLEVEPDNQQSNLSFLLIDELHRYLKQVPKIIITTKGKDYAFEAIKYETLDYLIKPIAVNDLRKSILRFQKSLVEPSVYSISEETFHEMSVQTPISSVAAYEKPMDVSLDYVIEKQEDINIFEEDIHVIDEPENPIEATPIAETLIEKSDSQKTIVTINPEKPLVLCVKSYGDYRYIDAKDIQYFQADNNSTDIYLSNGEMITAFKTLKLFEEILPAQFSRIHNSYIVNIDYVSRIHTGNTVCYIKNSTTKLPFSKSYKQNIDDIIAVIAAGNYLEV